MFDSFPRSTQCFPPRIWKPASKNRKFFAQQDPDVNDLVRREALAAWQLGLCSLREARSTLRQISLAETEFCYFRKKVLEELGRRDADEC